jgi:hypothetical protein
VEEGDVVKRAIMLALSIILALIVAVPIASGQSLDPGQAGAAWWQWALEKPTSENPQMGAYSGGIKCDGKSGQKRVWFLAGTLDGSSVTRTCTAPAGRPLFFPIVNTFHADPKGTANEEDFRQCVNLAMDNILRGSSMFATVDKKPVSGERADTPVFTFNLPTDNMFGAPSGPYDGVADGVWAYLSPLSKGKHTIHFGGDFPNAPVGGCTEGTGAFKEDTTYKLMVQ